MNNNFEEETSKLKLNSIKKVERRHTYIPKYCKNKVVLTIGCVDMIDIYDIEKRIKSGLHQFYNLRQTCKKVVGIDINTNGIELLKSKGFDIHEYDVFSEDENPVKDIEFDVLVLSHVIEHIPNMYSFLEGIIKKFKFKEIIVAVPNAYHFSRIYEILSGKIENMSNDHYYTFTFTGLINIMESIGFETIEVLQDTELNTHKINMYYDEGDIIYIGKL